MIVAGDGCFGRSDTSGLLLCDGTKKCAIFSIPFDGSIDFSLDHSTVGNYFHRRTL